MKMVHIRYHEVQHFLIKFKERKNFHLAGWSGWLFLIVVGLGTTTDDESYARIFSII